MLSGIGNKKVLLRMKILIEPTNYACHDTSSGVLSFEIICCNSAHKLFTSSSQFINHFTEALVSIKTIIR